MVIGLIITWVLLALIAVVAVGRNTQSIEELWNRADAIMKAVKVVQNNSLKTMMDLEVTKNEADSNSAEIDGIIKKMNAITADIRRLDEMVTQDHRDLVDIRERYILYRKPINWAGDYKEAESEDRS